jgi:hypothetical protein
MVVILLALRPKQTRRLGSLLGQVHNDGAVVGETNNRQVTNNSAATRQASSVKTFEFPNL